jgi:hypothetical protein
MIERDLFIYVLIVHEKFVQNFVHNKKKEYGN